MHTDIHKLPQTRTHTRTRTRTCKRTRTHTHTRTIHTHTHTHTHTQTHGHLHTRIHTPTLTDTPGSYLTYTVRRAHCPALRVPQYTVCRFLKRMFCCVCPGLFVSTSHL